MFIANMTGIVILLLIAGFILVTIEMIVPGFGAPGISGGICLVLAVLLGTDSLIGAVVMAMIILAILGVILGIVFAIFANKKTISPFVLKEELKKENGYISSKDLDYLLGKEGVTITDLRPAGIIDLDGIKFDVVSDGEFIEKNTKVTISKVEGVKLVVKRVKTK